MHRHPIHEIIDIERTTCIVNTERASSDGWQCFTLARLHEHTQNKLTEVPEEKKAKCGRHRTVNINHSNLKFNQKYFVYNLQCFIDIPRRLLDLTAQSVFFVSRHTMMINYVLFVPRQFETVIHTH